MISSGRRRYVWDRASQSVYRSPKQFLRPARVRTTPLTPPASRSSRTVLFPSAARHPRRRDDRSRIPLACAASVSSWHLAGISVSTKVGFARQYRPFDELPCACRPCRHRSQTERCRSGRAHALADNLRPQPRQPPPVREVVKIGIHQG